MKIRSIHMVFALILFYGMTTNAQELVAHYKFDGTLMDETMNGYDLIASSEFTPVFVSGKNQEANTAIAGFGISDFLSTTENLSISGNDERTFSAWVKTGVDDNDMVTPRGIIAHGENRVKAKFNVLISGAITRSDPRPISSIGASVLNTDDWKHIVVTYTNNIATLYVDGEKEVLSTGSNDFGVDGINTTASALRIGNDMNFSGERGFEGAIDDVRIYDKGLTADQVRNLYNGIPLSLNKLQRSKTQINAYPNPVKTLLSFNANGVAFVSVYDVTGKKMYEKKAVENSINIASLSRNVYIVKYFNNDKELLGISKIVKE